MTKIMTVVLLAGALTVTATPVAALAATATVVQPATVRTDIVSIANSELGIGENPPGSNCTKYGPCEAWCALFATWVWRQAGISIPQYDFTGDIYTWGQGKGRAHSTNTGMQPGDIVLYGTGPQNTDTSLHTGIVVAVGTGTITTVEGNSDNQVEKHGPFDPTHAHAAGRPGNIYGWVSAS
ncbi:CHAP domain-containing protein [Fodinicola feengrottensis]